MWPRRTGKNHRKDPAKTPGNQPSTKSRRTTPTHRGGQTSSRTSILKHPKSQPSTETNTDQSWEVNVNVSLCYLCFTMLSMFFLAVHDALWQPNTLLSMFFRSCTTYCGDHGTELVFKKVHIFFFSFPFFTHRNTQRFVFDRMRSVLYFVAFTLVFFESPLFWSTGEQKISISLFWVHFANYHRSPASFNWAVGFLYLLTKKEIGGYCVYLSCVYKASSFYRAPFLTWWMSVLMFIPSILLSHLQLSNNLSFIINFLGLIGCLIVVRHCRKKNFSKIWIEIFFVIRLIE